MLEKIITKNYKQTQEFGKKLARIIARSEATKQSKTAVVIALHGNLGGGKTTFLQGFAKGLGVKEKILSPTFVIQKRFGNFYHFDCYRINKPEEILELGWEEIISNPKNIAAIEWPEKIKKYLPKTAIKIDFKFIDENTREINFKM
jgi:tRNA threonylcarbamoyladenosine biosynthesis protein TsaE